jgi:rhodanese-related sulfurtransferase
VDIRSPEAYAGTRPEGAINLPWESIRALRSAEGLPEPVRGRTLLLLCPSGIVAADAARHLRLIGVPEAWNIAGGLHAWIASGAEGAGATPGALGLICARGETCRAVRRSPLHEQWAAVIAGFGVKPAYMVLSLVLIIVLWRSASPELVALRRSMVAFLIGEGFCWVNYVCFRDESHLAEFLHSYGMLVAFGFAAYAVLAGLDRHVLRFTDPERRCAAGALCQACIKQADAPCGLKRTSLLLIPFLIVVGLLPVCAELQMASYNTMILGTPYNWSHAVVYQIFETRFCPAYGAILLGIALVRLMRPGLSGVAAAKAFVAAGLGPIGFGFFRFALFGPFRDDLVWFAFWEEVTEMLFVAAAAWFLWVFRNRLFPRRSAADNSIS